MALSPVAPGGRATREELSAREAEGNTIAVASGHELASAEAVRVYRRTGNVVDAAVAGAAVLSVVLPYACGLGGDAFLIIRDGRTGELFGLNGSGRSPSGATLSRFSNGMAQAGITSATVPGALAAWDAALSRFGTCSLGELFKPAIELARNGFPAHRGFLENREKKKHIISSNSEATRLFMGVREEGDMLRQTDLADTLEEIGRQGLGYFYDGRIKDLIVTESDRSGGLFAKEDFTTHAIEWQETLRVRFYEWDVATMPPNSVGVVLLLQLLALQKADIRHVDETSSDYFTLVIAAWRAAVSTACGLVGDPEFALSRAVAVLKEAAESLPDLETEENPLRAAPSSGDTSNLSITDAEGNAVALVQSVSAPFGSGVIVPGTGILLNNRMRGFDTNPSSINCVRPGRRPAHTLVPVMASRGRDRVMALGTPGAAGQTITLAQFLSRYIAWDQDLRRAVESPRCSVGNSGNIILERTISPAVVKAVLCIEEDVGICDVRHERFGSVKAAVNVAGALRAVADYRRVADVAAL